MKYEYEQKYEPKKYCFKNPEHLRIQGPDFINVCSLTHAPQPYLVGSFSICQNLVRLIYVKVKI